MRKYSFLLLVFLLFITTGCGSPKPKLNIVMGLGEAEWKVMREVVFPPFEKLHGVKIEAIQINAADLPGVLETQVKSRKVKIDLLIFILNFISTGWDKASSSKFSAVNSRY